MNGPSGVIRVIPVVDKNSVNRQLSYVISRVSTQFDFAEKDYIMPDGLFATPGK